MKEHNQKIVGEDVAFEKGKQTDMRHSSTFHSTATPATDQRDEAEEGKAKHGTSWPQEVPGTRNSFVFLSYSISQMVMIGPTTLE